MKTENHGHGPEAVLDLDEQTAVLRAVEILRQAYALESEGGNSADAPLAAAWGALQCWVRSLGITHQKTVRATLKGSQSPAPEGRAKRLPRTAHFLTYSLASVETDGPDVALRFDYPGGYDRHLLSRSEAVQIAAEIRLALELIANTDGSNG